MRKGAIAASSSVADARVDSFFRLAFADSFCAKCKLIYEQLLIDEPFLQTSLKQKSEKGRCLDKERDSLKQLKDELARNGTQIIIITADSRMAEFLRRKNI